MALKNYSLHFTLWVSCDDLHVGMDAGRYKVYVMPLLFITCINNNYGSSAAMLNIRKDSDGLFYAILRGGN